MSELKPKPPPASAPRAATGQQWKMPALLCLLLAGLTFVLYFPVTHHDALNFDDPDYINNPQVKAGVTLAGVRWAFTTWHPLTWLSLMLDVQLFGAGPGTMHLVNLLWHTANAVLLFLLLRKMTGALWLSLLVAALFAWHPVQVEAVAWIAERKGVLSTAFGLATLLAYAGYVQESRESKVQSPKSKVCYSLALGFFILALLSKPMLVTLPVLMLLLDCWPLKRVGFRTPDRKRWLPLIREKIPFLALSALSATATVLLQKQAGALQTLAGYSASSRIENALVAYAHYLGKTFWPFALATPYPRVNHWPLTVLTLAFLLTAGLCVAALWWGRRRPFAVTGWFWFFGMLIPVIGLIQVGAQSVADRYAYLPVVGVFLLVAWGASEAVARWRIPKLAVGLAAALLLAACAARTRDQLRLWQNSGTLFEHAVAVSKDNWLAHYCLGEFYSGQNRSADAFAQYRRAAEIKPNYAEAWNSMGYLLGAQQNFAQAAACFEAATQARPDLAEYRYNFAKALNGAGQTDAAIEQFRLVIQQKPDFAIAHNDLGSALLRQRKFDEAITQFQETLRLEPNNPLAHYNLGKVAVTGGNKAGAVEHFRAALRARPDFAAARQELQALGLPE